MRLSLFAVLAVVTLSLLVWLLMPTKASRKSGTAVTDSSPAGSAAGTSTNSEDSTARPTIPASAAPMGAEAMAGDRAAAGPENEELTPHELAARDAERRASDGSSGVAYEHRAVFDLVFAAAQECYELAADREPQLQGYFQATVAFATDRNQGNIIGTVQVDTNNTTFHDPLLVECIEENVFQGEQILEAANASGKAALWGNNSVVLTTKFPLDPPAEIEWPADDARPSCPEETTPKHSRSPRAHWCEDAAGRKQGEEYQWIDGELAVIMSFHDGTSNMLRMRPADL